MASSPLTSLHGAFYRDKSNHKVRFPASFSFRNARTSLLYKSSSINLPKTSLVCSSEKRLITLLSRINFSSSVFTMLNPKNLVRPVRASPKTSLWMKSFHFVDMRGLGSRFGMISCGLRPNVVFSTASLAANAWSGEVYRMVISHEVTTIYNKRVYSRVWRALSY